MASWHGQEGVMFLCVAHIVWHQKLFQIMKSTQEFSVVTEWILTEFVANQVLLCGRYQETLEQFLAQLNPGLSGAIHIFQVQPEGVQLLSIQKKKKLKPNVLNGNPPWLLSGLGVVLLSPKTQVQSRPWWPLFRWRSKAKTPTCGDFGARFRSPGGQNWSGALHNDAPHSQGVASAR